MADPGSAVQHVCFQVVQQRASPAQYALGVFDEGHGQDDEDGQQEEGVRYPHL